MDQDWTKDSKQVDLLWDRLRGIGVSRREFLQVVAAAAGGLALTACGGETQPKPGTTPAAGATSAPAATTAPKEELAPDSGQVMRVAFTSEPTSFDYNKTVYAGGWSPCFAGLTQFDPNFEVKPWIATKWESNKDASVWTFTLRKDAKWTNGDPCNAKDFAWSFYRSVQPETGNPFPAYLFDIKNSEAVNKGEIKSMDQFGAKALDDYTLEVTLEGSRGYFPLLMAYTIGLPSHRATVEKYGEKWTEPANIVTNGAWKLVSWEHNRQFVVEAWDGYFGPKPKLKKVTVPIVGTEAGILPYENNEVDYVTIPAQEWKRVQSDPKLSKEVVTYSGYTTWYLAPEVKHPPFDDIRVRRAISHAIDRDRICKAILQGLGVPAYGFIQPGLPGYMLDEAKFKEMGKYDPKLAMDSLKGTPYEGGKNWPKITITMPVRDPQTSKPAAEGIQAMLKENLNLAVDISVLDSRVYYDTTYAHQIQLNFIAWTTDYPDPQNFYNPIFYSQQSVRRHEWEDKVFDQLLLDAAAEPDPKKRMDMYKQVETQLLDEVIAIYVYYRVNASLLKPWIKGVAKNKLGDYVPQGNIYRNMYNDDLYVIKH